MYDLVIFTENLVEMRWGSCVVHSVFGFTLVQALALICTSIPDLVMRYTLL